MKNVFIEFCVVSWASAPYTVINALWIRPPW